MLLFLTPANNLMLTLLRAGTSLTCTSMVAGRPSSSTASFRARAGIALRWVGGWVAVSLCAWSIVCMEGKPRSVCMRACARACVRACATQRCRFALSEQSSDRSSRWPCLCLCLDWRWRWPAHAAHANASHKPRGSATTRSVVETLVRSCRVSWSVRCQTLIHVYLFPARRLDDDRATQCFVSSRA